MQLDCWRNRESRVIGYFLHNEVVQRFAIENQELLAIFCTTKLCSASQSRIKSYWLFSAQRSCAVASNFCIRSMQYLRNQELFPHTECVVLHNEVVQFPEKQHSFYFNLLRISPGSFVLGICLLCNRFPRVFFCKPSAIFTQFIPFSIVLQ